MDEPYLKIGDVARKVGVSPSVIRSWESLGLARPRHAPCLPASTIARWLPRLARAPCAETARASAISHLQRYKAGICSRCAVDAPIQDSPRTGSPKAKPQPSVPRLRFSSKVHPSG